MKQFGLPRTRRLKKDRLFRALYDRKDAAVKTVTCRSIRIVYKIVSGEVDVASAPFMVGFTVGKGIKGVHRNAVRRYLREAFRLNQALLASHQTADHTLTFVLMYRGERQLARTQVPHDVPCALRRLAEALKVEEGWQA